MFFIVNSKSEWDPEIITNVIRPPEKIKLHQGYDFLPDVPKGDISAILTQSIHEAYLYIR